MDLSLEEWEDIGFFIGYISALNWVAGNKESAGGDN